MSRPPRFSGFDEQIRRPLQQSDPRSYRRVLSALETLPPDHAAPLSMLITRMVGKKFSPETAQAHWQHILALKERMQQRLDFTVDIQAAAIQHFAMLQPG